MKMFTRLLVGFLCGFLIVSLLGVVSIIFMAFTAQGDVFNRTSMFGAFYVSSSVNSNNNLDLTFGVGSTPMFVLLVVAVSLFLVLASLIFSALRRYRQSLSEAI